MNKSQVNYILAVDRLKNFGKAAAVCFVTQSTLSAMIKKYEQEIGIQIFDRSTKPTSTTAEGKIIIEQLTTISREFQALEEVIQEVKGEMTGELTIGVIPTIAPFLLPLFLNDFTQQLPNIKFEITENPTEKIKEGILNRSMDIGIVAIPLSDKGIVEHYLYEEPFVILDAGEILAQKQYEIEDLDVSRLWLLEEGHCMRNQVQKICRLRKQRLINGNLVYKSGTISTLIKLVRLNNGITLLPFLATADLPADLKKNIYPISAPVPARKIGIVVHKNFVKKTVLTQLKQIILKKITPLVDTDLELESFSPF